MVIKGLLKSPKIKVNFINILPNPSSMKYKLVVFDLDGTIVDDVIFIWQTLHDHFKTDKKERQWAIDQFHSKKLTYHDWAMYDFTLFKKAGALKKDFLDAFEPLKLIPNALETLKTLKKKGVKLVVISGSLNLVIEKLIPNHKELFDYVLINEIHFNKDGTLKQMIPTKYDFEHKLTGLKTITEKENIKLEECVFVGDHYNDVQIAEKCGLSIAFNCKSDELAQISDIIIKKKDLKEILNFI